MKNKTLFLTTLAAALSLVAVPASAGIVTYGTLSGWGTGLGTVTFEGVTIPSGFSTFTLSPLTFSSLNGNNLTISNNFGPGSGNFLLNASPTNIAGDGTVFGLAFNFRCYGCDGQVATITVTDSTGNTVFTVPTTSAGISNFFGVRSDLAIQNLQISFGGAFPFVAVDNVAYAAQNTPEAATMILIGAGLALLTRFRKYSSVGSFA